MEKKEIKQCNICLEDLPIEFNKSSNKNLNYSKCDHTVCKDCLSNYFKHEITENKIPIKCPGERCEILVEPSFVMNEFKENEKLLNKYLYFTLQKNDQISWCPTPDCLYGFMWEIDDPKFSCPKCNKSYCLKCKCEYHHGISCNEIEKKESDKNDIEFIRLAKLSKFKQCPECKRWIEKQDGCNHMTCICKYEFCYICGKKYSNTHGNCEYRFINENEEKSLNDASVDEIIIGNSYISSPSSSPRNIPITYNNRNNNNRSNNFNSFDHYNNLLYKIFVNPFSSNSIKSTVYVKSNPKIELRPTKNDGTLDMRYSVNKDSSILSTNPKKSYTNCYQDSISRPTKKDGTLDMRYSVNKNSTPTSSYGGSYSTYSNCKNIFIK